MEQQSTQDELEGYIRDMMAMQSESTTEQSLYGLDAELECLFPARDHSLKQYSAGQMPTMSFTVGTNLIQEPSPLSASAVTLSKDLPRDLLEQWLESSLASSLLSSLSSGITHDGTDYPICVISPQVAPLITIDAVHGIFKLCGYLPLQIQPYAHPSALSAYLAILPPGSVYPVLGVMVSWPDKLRVLGSIADSSGDPGRLVPCLDPIIPSQSEPLATSVRIHLENTLQLLHMGLTGHPQSRGKLQDDVRSLEQQLFFTRAEVQRRTVNTEILRERLRMEQVMDQQRTSLQTFYRSIGKANLATLCVPLSKFQSAPGFSYERHWRALSAVNCIKNVLEPGPRVPLPGNKHSDNVPLFLNTTAGSGAEPCEQFKPSLLVARFQRWVLAREESARSGYGETSLQDESTDLLLLDAESDFLRSNNLDVDTYYSLCDRHKLQLPEMSFRDTSSVAQGGKIDNATESDGSTRADSPAGSALEGSTLDGSLLDDYFQLDSAPYQEATEPRCEPAMHLPSILAWSILSPDASLVPINEDPRDQSHTDPDFIIEEPLPNIATHVRAFTEDSYTPIVQNTLKNMWPRLDGTQQHHLMSSLVRILASIWKNFDLLGGSALEALFDCDTARDISQEEGQEEQQIHERTRVCLSTILPTNAEMFTVDWECTKEPTRPKETAEERLCKLENEFLNRSFLDAFKEAISPMPRYPPLTIHDDSNKNSDDSIISVDCLPEPRIETEQMRPKDGMDENRQYSHSFLVSGSGHASQRMTTTKARAQESITTLKTHILPLKIDTQRKCSWMRPMDFSLDDVLVQAEIRDPTIADKDIAMSHAGHRIPSIVGVSRWKTLFPIKTAAGLLEGSVPRSSNMFQTRARSSSYPLVHLLTLPDVFCSTEFGGQDDGPKRAVVDLEQEADRSGPWRGLAYDMRLCLTRHDPKAGQFLALSLEDKERVLYHRWMSNYARADKDKSKGNSPGRRHLKGVLDV
ncbi:hypothetical protein BC939DRAFT_481781 [Gamsiella multidivaricata]|uniref:uncharacterized protein n=1 Tax=Gamsiella multidivaricata TaxID=101098 RepID=UPI00221FEE4D|nr:uncharacterized protein BC939DRAFT_481781 [Gamsiella multidivaricata]KAI7816701.1 hypothetical protein BC939DRAFT_481781 [Gamsiella multidivaricata]